eukprot:UN24784
MNGYWAPQDPFSWTKCANGSFCTLTNYSHSLEYKMALKRLSKCTQYHRSCSRDLARVLESMRWIWRPYECNVHQIEHFDQKIIFIGDSLNED